MLNPAQFGLTVRPNYMPEKLSEYQKTGVETVDPTTLIATQDRLNSRPALSKITPPGRQHPPQVYEEPSGERFIGDGHHRVAAHSAAGKQVRVQVWKRPA